MNDFSELMASVVGDYLSRFIWNTKRRLPE